jgi:hypothetical protein
MQSAVHQNKQKSSIANHLVIFRWFLLVICWFYSSYDGNLCRTLPLLVMAKILNPQNTISNIIYDGLEYRLQSIYLKNSSHLFYAWVWLRFISFELWWQCWQILNENLITWHSNGDKLITILDAFSTQYFKWIFVSVFLLIYLWDQF